MKCPCNENIICQFHAEETGHIKPIKPMVAPGKWCPACQQVRPYDDFWKNVANRDGMQSRCIDCIKHVRLGVRKPCPTCGSMVQEYDLRDNNAK